MVNGVCVSNLEKHGYENFKNTLGITYNNYYHDEGKIREDYYDKLRMFWDILYSKFVPCDLLDQFEEPQEGNPLTIEYKGRSVSFDLGMSLYEYYLLSKYMDFEKVNIIHEIGAGYGRTCYVISKIHPWIKYRIFDMEPSLGVAKQYLRSVLSDGLFEFNTPDKIGGECDLFLAIDCLHEMIREHVDEYFNYADKNSCYFYFTAFDKTVVPIDGVTWEIKDYPTRQTWKKIFLKTHGVRQGFFEALYKI